MPATDWEFQRIVSEAFRYLETECGYARSEATTDWVRYENSRMRIDILHDIYAFEAWLEFSRPTDSTATAFTLRELANVLPSISHVRGVAHPKRPSDLEAFLTELSQEAREILCSLAELPEDTYNRMIARREEHRAQSEAHADRMRVLRARLARERAERHAKRRPDERQ